jgi:hypothetical protein
MQNADKMINLNDIPLSTETTQQYLEFAGREFLIDKHSSQYSMIFGFIAAGPLTALINRIFSPELSIGWIFLISFAIASGAYTEIRKKAFSIRMSNEQLVKNQLISAPGEEKRDMIMGFVGIMVLIVVLVNGLSS